MVKVSVQEYLSMSRAEGMKFIYQVLGFFPSGPHVCFFFLAMDLS
jgi:hypothetical protein